MKAIRKAIAVFYVLAIWCAVAVLAQQANQNETRPASILASNTEFILTAIDERAVAQFKHAWRSVGSGNDKIEAAVLLYRKIDGSLESTLLPLTIAISINLFSIGGSVTAAPDSRSVSNLDDNRCQACNLCNLQK